MDFCSCSFTKTNKTSLPCNHIAPIPKPRTKNGCQREGATIAALLPHPETPAVTRKLVLLRHGQSQWNLDNRFTGWVDVDLTEQGRARRPPMPAG